MRTDLLRVVTLNIWNRQGPWPERLGLIRDGLAALDADVIGLQEVLGFPGLPSQADEIAAGTGWHVHHVPAWHIGGGLTFGNAILSRHPLRDADSLPLPSPPDHDTRTVAFARVDAPHGPFPVFVTHLTFQHHLSSARCAQVRALTDHVKRLAPVDGPPPILLGDFNADPDADEMRFLRGLTPLGGESVYFADAWLATTGQDPAAGPGWTYDRRNPYALRSREPSRRIDYVYVRGPDRHLRGEPLAARVALDQPRDGVWPSDHFAVVADLQVAVRPHDPY
ncbi:MAG: endonuclease/exonuclease/phosphatase family protein [Kofleriaceae bacterium]|nr:endonuclease/exonuclease/phosphatase family protein [Kofleriaceae bacterium]MCL4225370.1 endonuclease/exonuclease/phosphatase family protein [Myxococcales bacterium]